MSWKASDADALDHHHDSQAADSFRNHDNAAVTVTQGIMMPVPRTR
jgi:hypothetical protein